MRLGRKRVQEAPPAQLDPDLRAAQRKLDEAQEQLRRLRARVDAVQAQQHGMERDH